MSDLPLPRTALPDEVMRVALRTLERGRPVVMATVLRRRGSAPSTPGQKLALLGDEEAIGTVGGGAVEHRVLAAMKAQLQGGGGEPVVESFSLGASIGMCCGGGVEVLIEPLQPAFNTLIVGAGHIGTSLAPQLLSVGFRVTVCDAREEVIDSGRWHAQDRLQILLADHDDPEVLQTVGAGLERAALLVMTHDHQLDSAVVAWGLRVGFAFVGGVGSRAKAARTRARLEAKSFPAEDIARVHMPIGIDISARAPAEIAVSITGEMIRWRAAAIAAARMEQKTAGRAHDQSAEVTGDEQPGEVAGDMKA